MRGSVNLDGVEYGPSGGPERGFMAFGRVQKASWEAELAELTR